jgi:hypothetical protein
LSSPFNGVWKINLEKSSVWDAGKQAWISPDPILVEQVTMFITDEIYDQTITVGVNPTLHMGYTAVWDGEWVPYMVRDIEPSERPAGAAPHPPMDLGPFSERVVGQPMSWVKMIRINERFHYRLVKAADGHSPSYAMSRGMHDGDNSYLATVLDPAGDAVIHRHFDRIG